MSSQKGRNKSSCARTTTIKPIFTTLPQELQNQIITYVLTSKSLPPPLPFLLSEPSIPSSSHSFAPASTPSAPVLTIPLHTIRSTFPSHPAECLMATSKGLYESTVRQYEHLIQNSWGGDAKRDSAEGGLTPILHLTILDATTTLASWIRPIALPLSFSQKGGGADRVEFIPHLIIQLSLAGLYPKMRPSTTSKSTCCPPRNLPGFVNPDPQLVKVGALVENLLGGDRATFLLVVVLRLIVTGRVYGFAGSEGDGELAALERVVKSYVSSFPPSSTSGENVKKTRDGSIKLKIGMIEFQLIHPPPEIPTAETYGETRVYTEHELQDWDVFANSTSRKMTWDPVHAMVGRFVYYLRQILVSPEFLNSTPLADARETEQREGALVVEEIAIANKTKRDVWSVRRGILKKTRLEWRVHFFGKKHARRQETEEEREFLDAELGVGWEDW
ncbi:hypothetical protein BU24DRAFT_100354 [Aaosphaeria arxii CBS 175.79]|uniref:Uncharacterized protein n=1 Tax=Aaosphaeria arxii CBS 175.79 TaxID=1450172 RepID=A0A6A5Y0I7_9PLEO|nr:uncharacterized protein BU24DRAFT_100354 [Aaosphaeria arxii CBS 175.79]KAF2018597.1 hypothetical protein BU24DRAFT_100354 [Aaosphaeria arxii CBS 175.79]